MLKEYLYMQKKKKLKKTSKMYRCSFNIQRFMNF